MRLSDKAVTFITGLVLVLGVGTFVHEGDELFKSKPDTIQIAKADITQPVKTDAITNKYNTALPIEAVILPTQPEITFDADIQLVRADKPATIDAYEKLGTVLDYRPIPLDCTVKLAAQPLRNARVRLNVTAPCHNNQVVTIVHAGLRFNEYVDDTGSVDITIPVLSNPAEIEVSFADGIKKLITTQTHGLSSLTRSGIAWTGHNTLNLHVIETAHDTAKNAHISEQNKRTEEQSYFLGGGYLTTLGNPSIPNGAFIHIYTASTKQDRYVDFQLHMIPQSVGCQNTLELQSIHYNPVTGIQIAKKSTTINHCTAQSGNIVLKNMLRNMIVAQQN